MKRNCKEGNENDVLKREEEKIKNNILYIVKFGNGSGRQYKENKIKKCKKVKQKANN